MEDWNHELRLALTLLLNAGAFAAAFHFARRRGGGGVLQAACDAFLIYFVVQYVSVTLPAALGAFNLWTMSLVAFAAAGALAWAGARRPAGPPTGDVTGVKAGAAREPWGTDHFGLLGCAAFLAAYLSMQLYHQRYNPPIATDALVYHLPMAVHWIQTGRLGLFPTWYWNPAATYTPGTGSTFMAWLMMSGGNDVYVRFVQAPPLAFIFVLVARLCRVFGCGRIVAGLVALAAAASRPFFSEALIPKDDLFVTALFGAAVLALAPANLRGRLGPWRLGLAFGMVLASKYTVLLACPLFVFLVDAPFRARWRARDWLIASAVALALFAPWYGRNVVLTGNPLYPVDVKLFGHTVFEGLFGTERDQQLRSAGGVWRMLGQTYHSLPVVLLWALAAAWAAALAGAGRSALRDPLRRACLLGTPATFVLFLVTSPHHEVRYMYPLLLLVFGVAGMAVARWPSPEAARVAAAGGLAAASLATTFAAGLAAQTAALLAPAAVIAAGVVGLAALQARVLRLPPRTLAALAGAAACLAAMPAYIFWSSYVDLYYRKSTDGAGLSGISFTWMQEYRPEEPLWSFVRERVEDDATIAVANTFFVYPFQDAEFKRRLGHAPVRRGLHDFLDVPRLGDTVPGDVIVQRMTDVMNEDPDKATWLDNLRRLGAQYLVIGRFKHEADPPERKFVAEEPGRFESIFDDPQAGTVYRIRQLPDAAAPATLPR